MSAGRHLAAVVLLCVAAASWANGLWISTKASIAQVLIADSWDSGTISKPWPWADTWPVARLRHDNQDLYILAGSHGSALAFGPGHVDGTALPGAPGVSVVGGHRDTHFRFLDELVTGDTLLLQTPDMSWHRYEIDSIEIVNSEQTPALSLPHLQDGSSLVLVTCYPFVVLAPGGPLRYVVSAHKKGRLDEPASFGADG